MTASKGPGFSYLKPDVLDGFALLGLPVYIFSFVTEKICWSNAAALAFWNAESADELYARVLTPNSASTDIRLQSYRGAFCRGEIRVESWTYYPKGKAVTAMARCTGVRIDGHAEAMLVEVNALTREALPINELRSIEALRHTPLMISLFADNGAVLMRNPAAERYFLELDRALATDADHYTAMFATPEDARLLRAEAGNAAPAKRRCAIAIAGASPIHDVQVSRVADPASGQPALLVAQDDISQMVMMSRQLQASEDALDAVLDLNVVPALVVSIESGLILKSNDALTEILGRKVAVGEPDENLFFDKLAHTQLRNKALAQQISTTPLRLIADSGVQPWVMASAARITYARQQAIVMFVADINQLYQLALNLEHELDNERETAKLQRRILAVASHDVRTPLSIIDSIARRLEIQAGGLSEDEIVTRATNIRTVVNRIVELLSNTLERAETSPQMIPYKPEHGQLAKSIATVVNGFTEGFSHPSILLDLPDLPDILIDRALIEQAISNLIDNALKYSRGRPRIDITAAKTAKAIVLSIRDHGIGIPADEWGRVFSERERGTNVGETAGTGLGLSIVKQIVNMHGGKVEIVPTTGAGTTIQITLPLALEDAHFSKN